MVSLYQAIVPALLLIYLLRYLVRNGRRHSIAHLPGPASKSWLVGNMPDVQRPKEIGNLDFEWTNTYGNAVHIKGTFGSNVLFTSDPKAIQYIYNTSAYNFQKPADVRALTTVITGRGLVWAEGAQHARQRKIMNPAFSYSALRVFLPLFHRTAQRTVSRWKDIVTNSSNTSSVIDVSGWLARTTLDAIGEAAFDYTFDAINEEKDNKLANVYRNLFADSFLDRSDFWIAFESVWGMLPDWISPLTEKLPSKPMKRLSNYMKTSRAVARSLVNRELQLNATGKEGGKDVMSILVKANLSEDPQKQLSDDEILSQLTTLMLAGHETTASTVTWALYELSRRPDFQTELREEIKVTRARAAERGDDELGVADLDSMKYLLAFMKETLRYHPIVPALTREPLRDDIIPLSHPQQTKTGEMITAVPVSKGQRIITSIAAYNRLKSVWGDDADTWRPERFLEGVENKQTVSLGVLGNLATFSSGVRSCIGWRFALIEMQAILIELIENFEFSPPPGNIEILRGAVGIMAPLVKGSKSGNTEMPLTVTPVK